MKNLMNILYLTNPDYYLQKEGENIKISLYGKRIANYPIHNFKQIVCFNYMGMSPDLMRLCMEENISILFFTPNGKLCGRVMGKSHGNILTRKRQYKLSESEESINFVKNIVYAKLYNSKKVLIRGKLDHKDKVDIKKLEETIGGISLLMKDVLEADNKDSLRGIEGSGAKAYFSVLDELIIKQREDFYMIERSKRPPRDRFNALLSFMYSIYTWEITQSLESVGIDSYAGFFHTDRPGRASMALDIIEEFRPALIDKFCLSLINLNRINKNDFEVKENRATILNEKGRKKVLGFWREKKNEEIFHYYTEEKIKVGLLAHIQAQLLNSYIRGDLVAYPPYMLKG
ncbi:MAG: type I-C CRISPR-associated endonuclease Cas1c [Anaerococcus sp.]|nr:type I-C CRISPR-associated endonuclease Cas1c [Anaerococcus sp.]